MEYPVREVLMHDAAFPTLLREIPKPPASVFVRGTLPDQSQKLLAVVGSRKMTQYGRMACEALIGGLAGYPITIVSGLALGVDACGHEAALKAGLHCVGVPGSAISDQEIVPKSNFQLAKRILIAGGALLSEFPEGHMVQKASFPQRNRIMAGMCHATLLVEAGEKSGTLITARLATDFNRELLVVPGSIFSEVSKGVHQFLKLGATPVTTSADILEVLGFSTQHVQPQMDISDRSKEELRILSALSEPQTRDALIDITGFSSAELSIHISQLELDGLVSEQAGIFTKRI
jgi:DNA processing protein